MENYADYNFYISEFKGSLSIDLFNSLIIEASREIDRNVNCEITSEVIDALNDRDKWRKKEYKKFTHNHHHHHKEESSTMLHKKRVNH